MDQWQPHIVATTPHLRALGISAQDTQNYVSSHWLESVGRGAFKRPRETVSWQGALYSVQSQLRLPIHIAALTALEMTGNEHYLRLEQSTAYLFSPHGVTLPLWFTRHWGASVRHIQSKLLPSDVGLTERPSAEGYRLKTASPERAILEMLHLAPRHFDLVEAATIMEGLTTLRPQLVQTLLEACQSIKVKRLFLYLAERAELPVMRHLDVARVDLGVGDRSLVRMGRYVPKYQLLLPRELVGHGG
ncbi:MAG: hypothetical protein JWR80_7545 [Bradyrhizobium sp.]|nr:hypothetical protein [Bradyrhizobium sp.]